MHIKSTVWYVLRLISSLSFSISLFLFLAFVSVLGTFIEQDQALDYYQFHYPESEQFLSVITWKKIIWLGLDHMYSTYWFYIILFLFFSSLLICTLSTQLPILKYAKQWSFLYSQEVLEKKSIYYKLRTVSFFNIVYLLTTNNYYVFHKGKGLYGYKGLAGRIAPIFVHISIVISFIGFILRMTNGLVLQEIVPDSEIFHFQNIVTSGSFSSVSFDVLGKVDDFFVTFNKDKSIQQFFSSLTLMNNKKGILLNKYLWVNSPIKFNDLTIYQTDWQVNAIRLQIGKQKFIVKNLKQINIENIANASAWSCDFNLDKNYKFSIVVPSLLDNVLVYNEQGLFVTNVTYGEWIILNGVPILFKDLITSTGLQIKTDPGIPISYIGFAILIISIIASYVSYSQVWVSQNTSQLIFSGNTNRALMSFEDEIFCLLHQIKVLS